MRVNDFGSFRYSLSLITLLFSLNGCSITEEVISPDSAGTLPGGTQAASCHNHLGYGIISHADQVLCREGYAVGYNYRLKVADWIAYGISADSVALNFARNDNFRADPDLPESAQSKLTDYRGSGFDRGHLAPRATVDVSFAAMDESFLLSNIAPQLPELNRYGWADLEQYLRDCVSSVGELQVATGPYYNQTYPNTIGNGVAIPDGFYKVILKPGSPAQMFAFKIPHQALSATQLANYVTSVDAIEQATGIDFFNAIADPEENILEQQTTPICPLP